MDASKARASASRTRRVGQGAALLAAPATFLVADLGDALIRSSGQDDTTARDALQISATHPVADFTLTCVAMLGCLLLIPAVLGAMALMRDSAPRSSLVSGVLVIVGYVCYFALLFEGLATVSLARHGGASVQNIAVQDRLTDTVPYVAVALVFVFGNLIGTFLLGLAMLRSRTVARWAAYAVLAWPVLHVLGGRWGDVVGALLQAAGLAAVGIAVLTPHRAHDETPDTPAVGAGTGAVT